MNERIRELARQATDYAFSVTTLNETKSEWDALVSQKFAELIVKECAHIAWLYDEPKLSGHGAIIANSIKKHFGVEE